MRLWEGCRPICGMDTPATCKPDPSDVFGEERAIGAPSFALLRPDAPQRVHGLIEACNALRGIVRTPSPWPRPPGNVPTCEGRTSNSSNGRRSGFETLVHDLCIPLRWLQGRPARHLPPSSTAGFSSARLSAAREPGTVAPGGIQFPMDTWPTRCRGFTWLPLR